MKKVIYIILFIFLLALYYLYPKVVARYHQYNVESKILQESSAVSSETLMTTDSKPWNIQEHRGKKVVLIFWAKSCRYCVEEIPNVQAFYDKYKKQQDIEIMSYSRDLSNDVNELQRFMQEKNMHYPVLVDRQDTPEENRFFRQFKLFGLPSIFILDEEGKLLAMNLRRVEDVLDYL